MDLIQIIWYIHFIVWVYIVYKMIYRYSLYLKQIVIYRHIIYYARIPLGTGIYLLGSLLTCYVKQDDVYVASHK